VPLGLGQADVVERIGHREDSLVTVARDHDDTELTREVMWQQPRRGAVDGVQEAH